ncbi:SUMF1/EgtB/PvdO family nonheme iron enzyme [Odoribacter lunatus]|uniref:SUMF1/EgtB/PvdO family nonheme iron enzyme n=1 Tax=Odoribacter lunatus TaxID=2941335 RepID=UPI00203AFE31|nr:SUMF1/EgtB/PvdO family nonheme iron enzyme [Odoribacter lunatus]
MKRFFYLISGVVLLYLFLVGTLLMSSCSKDSDSELIETILKEVPSQKESTLSVSDTAIVFEAEGGEQTFTISCNSDWHIIGSNDWCRVNAVSGRGDQTITVSVSVYDGLREDRNRNLLIGSGDKMYLLNVTQKSKEAILLSKDKFNVSTKGGTISITVKSNIDYEVAIPEEFESWIALAPESRAVTTKHYDFTISENKDIEIRMGYIVFSGNSLSDTVYVYQAPASRLILTQDTCYVSYEGEEITVELQTNINYDVRIEPSSVSWIKQMNTRSLRTDRLHFSITENESRDTREAVIIVKDENGELSDTLCVRQYGRGLVVSGRVYVAGIEGDTVVVQVKGDVECEVSIPTDFQSWLIPIRTSSVASRAVAPKSYRFAVLANEDSDSEGREGYIVFSGNSLTDTVYVTQTLDFTETVSGVKLEMVYVKGGTFSMGATSEQGDDAYDREYPVHSVTLSDYYIGKFEVTQGVWEKVMGTTIGQQRDKVDATWSLYGVGSNYPMYYVNWNEAVAFCEKLSQLTGKKYALPTEAQWEYAARGGNKSKGYKYSGSNTIGNVAWYYNNTGNYTYPVGTKQSNELGIYDMSGNVWEWCNDWYDSYSSDAQTDPTGPETGSSRVLRGGSWSSYAGGCRVSYRSSYYPSYCNYYYGFRVVLLP